MKFLDMGRQSGAEFMQKSGLSGLPKVLLNGVPLEDSGITTDRFEETVVNEIMKQTPKFQRDILEGKLDDSKSVMEHIMNRPDVMPRLNMRILNDRDAFYLDMTDVMEYHPKNAYEFGKLREKEKTAFMISKLKYLKKNDDLYTRPVTVWIVADLETIEGRELYYNAIKHLKHSGNMRIGLIHNPKNPEKSASDTIIAKKVEIALRVLTPIYAKNFITKLVKEEFVNGLRSKQIKLEDLEVHGMNMNSYKKELSLADDDFMKIHSNYVQSVLEMAPGQMAIVANGRMIGPFGPKENLLTEDFELLEKHMIASHGKVIKEHIDGWAIDKELDKYEFVTIFCCIWPRLDCKFGFRRRKNQF